MNARIDRVALIGFGEAGGILGADFAAKGLRVTAFDILIDDENKKHALIEKARSANVTLASGLSTAVKEAQLVISAVTATSAHSVARECGTLLIAGQRFLEINSISPNAKRRNAQLVEALGALYVEAAVMAPVPPQRLRVPMLLGGAYAEDLATELRRFGMNVEVASTQIGVASAIKMCRSVMIKGLEALTVECLLAARRYDAEDAVLASLHASFPSLGWNADFPNYLISRIAEHGQRRAAEMREVAATLKDVDIEPLMAEAIARKQDALIEAMSAKGIAYDATKKFSWRELADQLATSA